MDLRRVRCLTMLAVATAVAAPAAAAVVGVGPGGFIVAREVQVAAAPERVYRSYVEDYGRWWHPSHSWSGDALNITLDARPGGCLCERWAGGAAQHMSVGYVEPGRVLRLVGGLGPLQRMGLSGTLNLNFETAGEGTLLKLEYRVAGFDPAGFDKLAPLVDGVLGEALDRLRTFVETGAPPRPPAGQ
jgi:uncharacterized protein YndB with AHSA1/START domain